MGQGITILYWWGPLGSLLGHFGSYFNAIEQEAGACLEPILSLFLTCLATQNYLKGPKSGTVRQDITILYWWLPLGAILGHFGPFQCDFRAQTKRLGPVWSLFVTHLATQNKLNFPKSGTVGQGMTILYWWGPLGIFWVILGHIRGILGPRARGWGLFGAYFSPVWLLKTTWIAPSLVQWERVLPRTTLFSLATFNFRHHVKPVGPRNFL